MYITTVLSVSDIYYIYSHVLFVFLSAAQNQSLPEMNVNIFKMLETV